MQERLKEMQTDLQAMRETHDSSVELIKSETSKLQDEMAKIQQHLEEQLREAQYRRVTSLPLVVASVGQMIVLTSLALLKADDA